MFHIGFMGVEPWSAGLRPGVRMRLTINAPDRRSALRFLESLHGFLTAHWDHEPVSASVVAPASWSAPVLWRFENGQRPSQSARGLAQSKTLRGFGWFMESLLSLSRMHWDHEPRRISWERRRLAGFFAGDLAGETPALPGRFMEWAHGGLLMVGWIGVQRLC